MTGMEISFGTLVFLVALALAFDFLNGLHDAANSIATVVSTGVLRPHQAVLLAVISWIFRRSSPSRIDRWFRRGQLLSSSLYSLGHGGNDAQKTIGIIWMLLIAAHVTEASAAAPPIWVIVSCYVAIAAGTMI